MRSRPSPTTACASSRRPTAGRRRGSWTSRICRLRLSIRMLSRKRRGAFKGVAHMAKDSFHGPLEQVDECCYRIPKSYKQGMRVDGLIFANEHLLQQIRLDQAPEQVANV